MRSDVMGVTMPVSDVAPGGVPAELLDPDHPTWTDRALFTEWRDRHDVDTALTSVRNLDISQLQLPGSATCASECTEPLYGLALQAWLREDAKASAVAADVARWIRRIRRLRRSGMGSGGTALRIADLEFVLQRRFALSPTYTMDTMAQLIRRGGTGWSLRDFVWSAMGIAPDAAAAVLFDGVADDMSDENVARCALFTWRRCQFPERLVKHRRWRELFRRAGYTADGEPADRENLPAKIVMYRGCAFGEQYNFSWTSNYSMAARYASRNPGKALVWVALVPRENVLASSNATGEHEYVIDTSTLADPGRSLPIRPLEMFRRKRHWPNCARQIGPVALFPGLTAGRCQDCGAVISGRQVDFSSETLEDAFVGRAR